MLTATLLSCAISLCSCEKKMASNARGLQRYNRGNVPVERKNLQSRCGPPFGSFRREYCQLISSTLISIVWSKPNAKGFSSRV